MNTFLLEFKFSTNIIYAACAAAVWLPNVSRAADIDCNHPDGPNTEWACASSLLIAEEHLSKVYEATLKNIDSAERTAFIEKQAAWLGLVKKTCSSEACLKHEYWSREAELSFRLSPRPKLFLHEYEQAEIIKAIFNSTSIESAINSAKCKRIFNAIKDMTKIHFVEPEVKAIDYSDQALAPWKNACIPEYKLNMQIQCQYRGGQDDVDGTNGGCTVFYEGPPFKIYSINKRGGQQEYVYYSGSVYGAVNQPWQGDKINYWMRFHVIPSSACEATKFFAGLPVRQDPGKNYGAVIQYEGLYYALGIEYYDERYHSWIRGLNSNVGCGWNQSSNTRLGSNLPD